MKQKNRCNNRVQCFLLKKFITIFKGQWTYNRIRTFNVGWGSECKRVKFVDFTFIVYVCILIKLVHIINIFMVFFSVKEFFVLIRSWKKASLLLNNQLVNRNGIRSRRNITKNNTQIYFNCLLAFFT